DRNGTIGQNLHLDPQPELSQQPFTSCSPTLPPPPLSTSCSSAPPSNYGNYQNCTIVQSHLPCPAYGTYVSLAPKTLIFPIFVQPLDLCSPERTLLMSEEMVLHQANLLPAKVTVLIYSDLLLLTREDEAGRCNVLQSPLYLNTLQLREGTIVFSVTLILTCMCLDCGRRKPTQTQGQHADSTQKDPRSTWVQTLILTCRCLDCVEPNWKEHMGTQQLWRKLHK
uniref:Uncharacterized protein n=1 Tax=Mastacembelus armatus TaxID=205130 RepID=A0A7N8WN44_9TELE